MENKLPPSLLDFLTELDSSETHHLRFFLITRQLKEGVPSHRKMLDKYEFTALQVEIDTDLQQYLLTVLRRQLRGVIESTDVEVKEYDVLGDELPTLYTYAATSTNAFCKILNVQLAAGVDVPQIKSLEEVTGKLWAYCIAIQSPTTPTAYTFRKLFSNKVVVEESENATGLRSFLAYFDTRNTRLERFEGQAITLDKRIDCLYLADQFFVFEKARFEQMVGMEEEFKASAVGIIDELNADGYIQGTDLLRDEVERSSTLIRKLAKLAQLEDYHKLSPERIKKMANVAKRNGIELKIVGGRVQITTLADIDVVIKLLMDSFLESKQTGNRYEARVKTRIQTPTPTEET